MAWLADAVFVLHGVFVLAIVPSTLLALFGFYASHLPIWKFHNTCLVIVLMGHLLFQRCSLVVLEAYLRSAAGQEMPYTGGYTRYVVEELTGVLLPPRFVMTMTVVLILSSVIAFQLHWPRPNRPLVSSGS